MRTQRGCAGKFGHEQDTERIQKTKGLAGNHRLTPVILGSPTWARTRDLRINSTRLDTLAHQSTPANATRFRGPAAAFQEVGGTLRRTAGEWGVLIAFGP